MKALAKSLIITTLIISANGFAQTPDESVFSIENATNLETDLIEMNQFVDEYFKAVLVVTAKLEKLDLKLTSPKTNMPPELAQEVDTLEKSQEMIIEGFDLYRKEIQVLSETGNATATDNSKFLYNLLVIKAFLPRFELPEDTKKESLLHKILTPEKKGLAVEPLIKREVALSLIYTDFKTENANRSSEMLKTYENIITKINTNRNTVLYPHFPQGAQSSLDAEAKLYTSMIKGEEYVPALSCKKSLFSP